MRTENIHQTRRVVLFGPESSGKTTLCIELAKSFQGEWVPEFLRTFCESNACLPLKEEMPEIFLGQKQSELSYEAQHPAFLFYDTNPLQLFVYHQVYFGECLSDEAIHFSASHYDLYLLCAPDLDWIPDPLRDMPEKRIELYHLFKSVLDERKLSYRVISGTGMKRTIEASRAIMDFFQ